MPNTISVKDRIESMRPDMEQILWEYLHGENPAIFTLKDKAIQLCEKHNMLRVQKCNSRYVVVHPRNRYGDGLVPSHVYKLIDSNSLLGFSEVELGVPLASEVPPVTHARGAEVRAFNEKLVKDAQGMLPQIAEEEYLFMSLAKSHSNAGSRCVMFELPHTNKRICDGGKLSLQKIKAVSPEYADAIEGGFSWHVLIWQVEDAFPKLIDLLMETGNVVQQQAMDETRFQVALKISNCAQRLVEQRNKDIAAGRTPSTIDEIWRAVEREALRGSPKFSGEVVDLQKYVKSLGGNEGVLLKDIISFSKTLRNPRVVTGTVLAAIAKAPLGEDGHGAIHFRQDLIKAMLGAGEKYVKAGGQNIIDAASIATSLPKKNVFVIQANKMKIRALELLEQQGMDVTVPLIRNALDLLGMRLVHHVLEKPDPRLKVVLICKRLVLHSPRALRISHKRSSRARGLPRKKNRRRRPLQCRRSPW